MLYALMRSEAIATATTLPICNTGVTLYKQNYVM